MHEAIVKLLAFILWPLGCALFLLLIIPGLILAWVAIPFLKLTKKPGGGFSFVVGEKKNG